MGFFDRFVLLLFVFFVSGAAAAATPTAPGDAAGMRALADAIGDGAGALGWSKSIDPCDWPRVTCSSGRVTAIQVGKRGLAGTLPADLFVNLTALTRLELMENDFSGPLPSLSSLSALQVLLLHSNRFSSVPDDMFSGMPSLTVVSIDQNPFERWEISPAIMGATSLVNFSATSANISGAVPKFFATAFPSLYHMALSYNYLAGPIPDEYRTAPVRSLWLNGQNGNPRLSGSIDFIKNLTSIVQLWLQSNSFSGPIPDVSELMGLQDLNLRDNQLTGTVPQSLTSLTSLTKIALTNNLLQGPTPVFSKTVDVDLNPKSESFCLDEPGECDARVAALLSIVKDFGYPVRFAQGWKGNDPCAGWLGITCDASGNVSVVNFQSMGLQGTISPEFTELPALQQLLLANNNISGVIPDALTKITSLRVLDVSNNSLWGDVPKFRSSVAVNTYGNPNIGKASDAPGSGDGGGSAERGGNSTNPGGTDGGGGGGGGGRKHSSRLGVIVGSVIGVIVGVFVVGVIIYYICKRDKKKSGGAQYSTAMVIHPQHSGSGSQLLKISVAGPGLNDGSGTNSQTSSTDLHVVESGSMTISIQVLRNVTNNFNEDNILGRGGFGTVYKGELHDGTKIAVKRMESGVMGSKGLAEFQAEISVLTKVRHRHLVSLLGYCLDGNEKILVYEHMPQGTLSHHLFRWKDAGLKPLDWKRRLSIALDVARGVEYLHSLAHKSFIHRDLKPSNILLGDDMKAKVADFGLVRLAPEGNNVSVETKLAGTFGYLAPEYAVTGRVTTKADVYSFGVILMELITGRKALDESQPEERVHLVTWFRRVQLNKDTFDKVIDPTIDLDEETFQSISTISELASHCCAREPYQRPDMGHAVNVLSSLAEIWKPTDTDFDDCYGVDFTMSLPQTLKKWQAFDDSMLMDGASSSFLSNSDSTQTSIPTKPFETFTSADAR